MQSDLFFPPHPATGQAAAEYHRTMWRAYLALLVDPILSRGRISAAGAAATRQRTGERAALHLQAAGGMAGDW